MVSTNQKATNNTQTKTIFSEGNKPMKRVGNISSEKRRVSDVTWFPNSCFFSPYLDHSQYEYELEEECTVLRITIPFSCRCMYPTQNFLLRYLGQGLQHCIDQCIGVLQRKTHGWFDYNHIVVWSINARQNSIFFFQP